MRKKKFIIIISVAVIITLLVSLVILFYKRNIKTYPVIMELWNNELRTYTLCSVTGEVQKNTTANDESVTFITEMSMDEIAGEHGDYVGEMTINYFFKHEKVYVFCASDNYYCVIKGEDNVYTAEPMYGKWQAGGYFSADIRFPFPEPRKFYDEMDYYGKEGGYDIIGDIFELYSFDCFKEFYSRISDEYYSIDEVNQTITLKAYGNTNNISWDSGYYYEIVIDCKNKTISGPGEDDSTIVLKRVSDL
ncbi:MAG: hypothetical protein IJZ25_02980 [Lachnospiraceae bacterium]|nr:hypothetical protein [Lachnospiraceae bacterium]